MTDELNAPLGVEPETKPKRRWPLPPLMPLAAGLVGLIVLGLIGTILLVHNPLGGEPRALAAIAEPKPRQMEPVVQPPPAAAPAATPTEQPEGTTINVINGMSGAAQQVRIATPPPSQERATGLDPRLSERTPHGPLPRVAPDGRRPLEAYARAFRVPTSAQSNLPRIAILIGGLGISANGTSEAITKLPGAVSLAFAPYGNDLERAVMRARSIGHEVFLQVPMEPFDYPENDPGPQTLLTTLSAERNTERLFWAMGRFQGYVGIVNYMGAKFTATEQSLAPMLREANRRGLMMIDDGSSPRSLIGQLATGLQQPNLRGDIQIDRVPTPAELDAQLSRLEARAREKGFALGIGSALPVTIDRVANWARALEERGIILVPVTTGVARRPSSG
ncbi:divergent polysaccharide deacetylase family protein [Phreatobacter aquaticus]|uniref:Divergent polysaccharide deacetylase family protein n=1 Tax=Phreatobacter aquaticus TaxID=2570229 RepID=A0A4D7QK67_9HYPH|nr:divergent polysaccharide deacetylase family protein [Phreatobacter aquaticus]QCK85754.1 divergent polysaccharide deacetylase family protein [Phreatobacter aquaticus]